MKYKDFVEKYLRTFGLVNVKQGYIRTNNSFSATEMEVEPDGEWEIYLNHSCDEWTIGSVEDAEALGKDLAQAIQFVKENTPTPK